MKAFVILLISTFLITSCSTDEPTFIEETPSTDLESIIKTKLYDDNDVLITTDYLKEKWQKELADEGNPRQLGEFEIVISYDDNGEKYIFLKVISADGTFETGAFITKKTTDKGEIYNLERKECSCTGCPTGCRLITEGSNCACSGCPNPGDCVKTETGTVPDNKE